MTARAQKVIERICDNILYMYTTGNGNMGAKPAILSYPVVGSLGSLLLAELDVVDNSRFVVRISMLCVISCRNILAFPVWRPHCYFRLSIISMSHLFGRRVTLEQNLGRRQSPVELPYDGVNSTSPVHCCHCRPSCTVRRWDHQTRGPCTVARWHMVRL